jgi:hypothetical protein
VNGLFDIQGTQDDFSAESLPRLVSVYGMAGSSLGMGFWWAQALKTNPV